jgi:segregation and condensation protein A
VDLRQISILALVDQYIHYIERAEALKLELAADYLVMAAWLAYLKSRCCCPRTSRKTQAPKNWRCACNCGCNGSARCARPRRG